MKLLRILLVLLFLQLSVEANAQWSVKHLDASELRLNNLVKFRNDSLGLFMGDNSMILKSIDAGETWKPIIQKTKVNFFDFQFVGNSTVYAVGASYNGETRVTTSKFIRSLDNGETWDSIASFPEKQLESLSFLDTKTGFVGGFYGIYRTSDSGYHWNLVWDASQLGYGNGNLEQIFFPTSQIGYGVGLGYTKDYLPVHFIVKTTDSGITWDTICTLKYYLTSIYFLNADIGFVGTNSNVPLKTIDGGHTWTEVKTDNSQNFISSIQFISDKIGFATGGHLGGLTGSNSGSGYSSTLLISKTIDCGETWQTFNSSGIPLNSIFFISDSTGFVSGAFSLIMKTSGKINELPANYPWYLVDDGSLVKDVEDPNSLVKAFPNPTIGILNIQLKNTDQTVQTIRLLSSSGQLINVGKPNLNSGNIQFDLSGLVSGMYFLKISFSGKTELVKVLKE
jgi:photosystem II stability/assembly factor-like uncharacterized protein